MTEDARGESIENRGWRDRLRSWKSRVSPAPDGNSDPATEMQQPAENSKLSSLASMASTSVDIPIEYADNREGGATYQNIPNVVISRNSSEPAISHGKMSVARSAFSARSNLTTLGIERTSFIGSFFQVWDNRLALKLFGSRQGILKEEERLQNCQHRVIHPCSKFR